NLSQDQTLQFNLSKIKNYSTKLIGSISKTYSFRVSSDTRDKYQSSFMKTSILDLRQHQRPHLSAV
ncbi:MAG: hypothetical protein QE278_03385, partial [Limnobacter sp.]|nr:hypothetical protein [Limnobacter sp.]